MSKLTFDVEKERVDFIFGVPLTEVVLELNKLIKKYGGDATLGERYDNYETLTIVFMLKN
jgi:hypothetical protein